MRGWNPAPRLLPRGRRTGVTGAVNSVSLYRVLTRDFTGLTRWTRLECVVQEEMSVTVRVAGGNALPLQ